jgi:hypothetical protein
LCGRGLLMNSLMDFARLRFIHGKNLDQILDRRVAQSFEIGEASFHEQQRLVVRNRERTLQRLRRLRDFLFDRVRRGGVAVDVDFPAGQPRG